MNSYSLKWWIIIHLYKCCNINFLVGVWISKINTFSNKQTFHMHIIIIKIKKKHKKIANLSFKFKKYYFIGNIIIWVKYFLKYILILKNKMFSFHYLQDSIIMLSPNKWMVIKITLQYLLFLVISILIPM